MTLPASPLPEGPEKDVAMPLTDHLTELRRRLIISVAVVLGGFVVATSCEMEFQQPILSLFRRPLDARNIPLVFDELTEPFFTYLAIGLYTSLFLTFPVVLSQLWLFISPALYNHERKAFWPFLLVSYPLFVGGGMFGYFAVLPFGYDFFLGFENQFTLPSLRMGAYLSLTVKLLFAFGLIFELPTIIYILARMGLVEADWLRQNRKYSLVIVFILAAILTPPDVVTQTLMAGPLIILYEISIWVAKMASPNEKTSDTQTDSP